MKKGKILVELQETMGDDESIANAAWTSTYDKDNREAKSEDADRIANIVPRLIRDGHGTPVESVVFRFWIRMPIFTDRQHMTHRMASHNGLSGRYRTMPMDHFELPEDIRHIYAKAFGMRDGMMIEDEYDGLCTGANVWYRDQVESLKRAEANSDISNAEFKRAREVLRGVLPQAGMIERTTIMNLRSFANYQKQRNSDHAQPEIREVARLMLKEVENSGIASIAISTLKEIGWKI